MNRSSVNTARFLARFLALGLIPALATGCASIIKGADQSVSFRSDPAEARLIITDLREGKDIHVGTTPFTTSLRRGAGYFQKSEYKVRLEKPGYRREEILLEGTPSVWYVLGNFIFGGLIGWLIVDPVTGAMWTLDPEEVNVTLQKDEAFRPPADGATPSGPPQGPVNIEDLKGLMPAR